ncbi:MAG: T9SS type A sorting domain-containing protein [Ignavibacteria bacterium]|nr:T9SS type A sorting domain-containing protein [Ignavibacteria bacterium]
MRKILFALILSSLCNVFAQNEYRDKLLESSVYDQAPAELKNRKAFIREWKFFEERAFPEGKIPNKAYENSIQQRNQMRVNSNDLTRSITWTNLGPTPGYYSNYGNISSRIVTGAYNPTNPNIIYIGPANGGVWKSIDNGTSWTPLTDDQPSLSMGAIAIDPTNPENIYAGTGEATYSGASYYGRGLLKSTNGGATWQHITSGLPSSSYFSRIVIRPGNSIQLLAALGTSGLYRSTNSGVTWTQLLAGRCDDVIYTASGDTAFAVGNGIGMQRSINGGATFSSFSSNLPDGTRTHFDLCLKTPSIMYAAVYASSAVKVYKSTDNGVVWNQIATSQNFDGSQAWYDLYCKVHPKNPNVVFVGTIDVYRSTNGGANFSNITNGYSGGNVHVDQHNLVFHPSDDNTILSLNDGGIYRSTNLGASFENLNEKLTLTQFYRIAASPFTPARILGGTQDNGTQQTYGTMNWAAAFGGDGGEVCFNPFNSNFIIGETQNGGLRRTTNGGSSWISASSGISTSESVAWVAPIIAHPVTSGTFYVARTRVYRSIDNGGSWTAISGNVNGTTAVRELAISKSNPLIMYATSSSKVFKSEDGGVNWTNVTFGLPNKTITSVYVHPTNSSISFLTFSGFGTEKVYRSTNGGTSWSSIHANLPDSPANDMFIYPDDPDKTYFISSDVGVFMTTDSGLSWIEIYQGLPNTVAIHLDYSPTIQKLRVGTHGRGVFEASLNLTGTSASFTTQSGWNLLSIPLNSINKSKDYFFPNSNSYAYTYENGYQISDSLMLGVGYWLKFPSVQSHTIYGEVVNPHTINLSSGWNIIGAMNSPIQTNSITTNPSGIISSQFFAYDNGYNPVTVLEVGKGHWLKTNASGSLTFTTTSYKPPEKTSSSLDETDKIVIKDDDSQTYSFYFTDRNFDLSQYELPPSPPSGSKDARFISNRFVESAGTAQVISISNLQYPISLNYNSKKNSSLELSFISQNGPVNVFLKSGEEFIIHDSKIDRIKAKVSNSEYGFSLAQNYPNPFNSSTLINFEIPKSAYTTLKLFDLLGRELKILVQEKLEEGKHFYKLDVSDLSSGVYFYSLNWEGNSLSKRMILIK